MSIISQERAGQPEASSALGWPVRGQMLCRASLARLESQGPLPLLSYLPGGKPERIHREARRFPGTGGCQPCLTGPSKRLLALQLLR